MKAVSISVARKNFKELVKLAEGGETFAVTQYSKVVALLSPPPEAGMKADNRKKRKTEDG